MSLREVLVVVDDAASVPRRMAAVAALPQAAIEAARVTGLFASGFPIETAFGDVAGWMQLVDSFREAQRGAGAAAEAAFRHELAQRQLAGDWIFREDDATATVVALSPLYDLIVLGQPNPDAEPLGSFGLRPAEIVLGAGGPALIVPYAGDFAAIGRRVLVAWNASREAARALHDAQFVLQHAEAVTVIEVEPTAGAGTMLQVTASDVAAALARRGIAATAETETGGDIAIDDLLLSRAADLAADLLVMGAWGHSRLREYVLGGVSRGILQHMTLPVLMSH